MGSWRAPSWKTLTLVPLRAHCRLHKMEEIEPVRLCKLDEIPFGQALGFAPFGEGQDTIFIVHLKQGPVAYKDVCPHYGSTSLPWRKNAYLNASCSKIVCAAHGAQFELETGLCISGPCLGESLTPVPLTIADDGWLLAMVDDPVF